MKPPKYQHDCDCCEFIGHICEHDVYLCRTYYPSKIDKNRCSILARFGNEPPDYASSDSQIFGRVALEWRQIHDMRDSNDYQYFEYIMDNNKCQQALLFGYIYWLEEGKECDFNFEKIKEPYGV